MFKTVVKNIFKPKVIEPWLNLLRLLAGRPVIKILVGSRYRRAYTSAGLDVFPRFATDIRPGESILIKTGVFMELPVLPGNLAVVAQVWARSGLSVKNGIEVGAGLIDNDYLGEIGIHLYNHGTATVKISTHSPVAQLCFPVVVLPATKEVLYLTETKRGSSGYGSSDRGER